MIGRAILAAGVAGLTLLLSGVLATPTIVFAGFQNVDAPGGTRRVLVERADLRVDGTRWRPVHLTFTLAPTPDSGGRTTRVRLEVEGRDAREIAVAAGQSLAIDLPRLRGLGSGNRVTLVNLDPSTPVDLRDASAATRLDWSLWLALAYGAALGAGLMSFVGRRARTTDGAAAPGVVPLTLLAVAIAVLRKPDALFLPQLWAEDGAVFLKSALTHGIGAVVEPYSGYHHLFPRLVAAIAALLPATVIPLAFNVAAAWPLMLIARRLASPRLALTRAQRVACLLIAVVPPMPGEVLLNLTNTPWLFGLVLVLVLLAEPARARGAMLRESATIVVAGLTGPLCLALAPLFAWRAYLDSTAGALRQAALVAGCAMLQGVTLAFTRRFGSGEPLAFDLLLSRLGQRMLDLTPWTPDEAIGFILASAALALVVLGLVLLVARRDRRAAFSLAAALVVSVVVLFGIRNLPGALAVPGGRYFSAPMVLLLWSAVLVGPGLARPAAALVAVVLILGAVAFAVPPLPDLHWASASACLDQPNARPCSVSINPIGWSVDIAPHLGGGPRP